MAKVLLVEDDNNLREIYQARLMAEGYDIVAAQNGEEALVVAKQNKPDLIISDVMMPRISGFEMLDILRNTDELKSTKVIMLTALGQAEDQKRASGLGADKYLVKSQVTLEDIVNAAKELLGEDGGVADVPPAPAMPDPIAATEPATPAAAPAATPTPAPAATTVIPVATPPEPVAAPAAPVAAPAPTPAPTPTAPPAPAGLPEPPLPPAPTPAPEPATPPAAAPAAVAPTVATTTVPVVEPPAATPAPAPVISMPGSDPAPVAATAAAAVSDAATQSLEAEEAALQSQIDSYASAPAETPTAVSPEEAKAEASNNQTITSAVEQLNNPAPDAPLQPPSITNAVPAPAPAPTPEPATPPAAAPAPAPTPAPAAVATPPTPEPAPTPAASGDNNVSVAGRKVIQPISDPAAKPDLDALLAKEEAAASAAPAAPVVDGAAAATPPTPPAHAPGQTFDPNKAL